jgi:hypothetical protein
MATTHFKPILDFKIYWKRRRLTFRKPADAIALFFHWCMIKKNFKHVNKVGKKSNLYSIKIAILSKFVAFILKLKIA